MVRDPCNFYTKEPFPQSHAGEQYTVSSRRSLSLSHLGIEMLRSTTTSIPDRKDHECKTTPVTPEAHTPYNAMLHIQMLGRMIKHYHPPIILPKLECFAYVSSNHTTKLNPYSYGRGHEARSPDLSCLSLNLLLHFMICHSNKCHRPRTSSCHKEQRGGTEYG